MLKLSRELRFGLSNFDAPLAPDSSNGFAANPPLLNIDPFLLLTTTISGQPDPATGMLMNIKTIDHLLRLHAVPFLREKYLAHKSPGVHASACPPAQFLPELHSIITHKLAPHTVESIALHLSPFLHVATYKENPSMVHLSLRFEFSAAHRLYSHSLSESENQETFGRCTNPNGHGHNYELQVTLAGTPNPLTGEILPIPQLQQIVNQTIINHFDHKHLNLDCPEFKDGPGGGLNPTVENIAKVIYQKLKPAIEGGASPAKLAHIRVWETPKTLAEYSEP